jgi:hypothetical protein
MKKYDTVEEYIEVISGYRDVVTGKPVNTWMFSFDPIISLARYDVGVLTSMCESTTTSKALTERQGELACKILLKYQRQLATKGIDVSPIERPVWRTKLRKMDYTKSLTIHDDNIVLQFPYSTELIERLRTFRKDSQGRCAFDKEKKQWLIALTEYNLNYCHAWAASNGFTIGEEVTALVNKIEQLEQQPYAIELYCNGTSLDIRNCPESLRDYVETHLGGFAFDNLLRLVDASSDLAYTIDEDLSQAVIQEWGTRFLRIATNREVKINSDVGINEDHLMSVLDYAVKVGRLPVVIYEPDLSIRLFQRLRELYPDEQIVDVGNGKNVTGRITADTKFIYTTKPIKDLDHIPMLISSSGMIFGGDKQTMLQRSSKVVYTAADVYTKGNTGKKVIKIAG